jgi:hemerythrin superfamily protein
LPKREARNCPKVSIMPTARKSSTRPPDALKLLIADHRDVDKRFKEYQKMVEGVADDVSKLELAQQICAMLVVHTTIEEELFYPAAREALDEQDLLDEAEVEHASAKELIAQIQASSPEEELYDAKVHVLGEYIKHHVKEEEDELFPKLRKTELDLAALGAEMAERKQALASEIGLLAEEDAPLA